MSTLTQNPAGAHTVMAQFNLTAIQLGTLRRAVRKWADRVGGELHDGSIDPYHLDTHTRDVLLTRGLIQSEPLYTQDIAAAKTLEMTDHITTAFQRARSTNPLDPIDGGTQPSWKAVLSDLKGAESILLNRSKIVLRITPAGILIAKAWRNAIHATEESLY